MAEVGSESKPLDTLVHRGTGTLIGAFRCPTRHPRFHDSGPIQNDIFVFPRSSVRIRHAGGPSFVADHTTASIYNQGQVYDRGAISEEGDRSDWFAVPRRVATEAVVANHLEPAALGPFPLASAPVGATTYLRQRRLFRAAVRGTPGRVVDEDVYALLDDIVAAGAARRPAPQRDRRSLALAEEIRALVSARFEEEWPLGRLEKYFGVSPFRLCRSFRGATGSTIHQYLLTLRLRASLERLEQPRVDLAALAHDLGFSSHSHFSLAFGRTFAESPSTCRRALALA